MEKKTFVRKEQIEEIVKIVGIMKNVIRANYVDIAFQEKGVVHAGIVK